MKNQSMKFKKTLSFWLIIFLITSCSEPTEKDSEVVVDMRDTILSLNLGWQLNESIPDSIFLYNNLESLNICCNDLSQFDLRICDLGQLKYLGLYHTKIKDFPDQFYALEQIEELDMTSMYELDYQSVLPKLHKFSNLKKLNLGCNQMKSPQLNFAQMKSLEEFGFIRQEELDVEMFLKKMSAAKNLRVLHLSVNNIKTLPPEIALLENLEELNLFDNELTILPIELVQLKRLKKVSLTSNPINHEKIKELESLMPNTQFIY
jgi:Leucine-rich repeat (LRR) protein